MAAREVRDAKIVSHANHQTCENRFLRGGSQPPYIDKASYLRYNGENFIDMGFQCQTDFQSVGVKGNQVQILSDPVTVSEECDHIPPLRVCVRRHGRVTIREPGSLLKNPGKSFRRKRITGED